MLKFTLFAISILLVSCSNLQGHMWSQATPEELKQIDEDQKIAQQKAQDEDNRALQELIDTTYKPKCRAIGFKDEKELSQCVLTLITNDENKRIAEKSSRRAAAAAYLYGSQRKTTNCVPIGNGINCSTF